MKKARVMLIAIAMVATVGGALAVKAKTASTTKTWYYYGTNAQQSIGCVLTTTFRTYVTTIQSAGVSVPYSTTFATTTLPSACQTYVTFNGAE